MKRNPKVQRHGKWQWFLGLAIEQQCAVAMLTDFRYWSISRDDQIESGISALTDWAI